MDSARSFSIVSQGGGIRKRVPSAGPPPFSRPGTTIGRLWAEVTPHREAPMVRRERRKEIRFPRRDPDLAIRLPEAIPFGMGPVESWDNPNKQDGVLCSIAPFGGTV